MISLVVLIDGSDEVLFVDADRAGELRNGIRLVDGCGVSDQLIEERGYILRRVFSLGEFSRVVRLIEFLEVLTLVSLPVRVLFLNCGETLSLHLIEHPGVNNHEFRLMRLHRDFSAVNRVERRVRFIAEAASIRVHAEIRVTREIREREPVVTHLLRDLAHFLLTERFPEILCDIFTALSGTGLPRHLDTVTRVLGHFTHRVGDTDVAFKHVLIAAETAGGDHDSLCRHLAGLPILTNDPNAGHIALGVLDEFSGPG